MALLPKKVGSVTLMRTIDTDGRHTAYAGILDHPPGKACVAQKIPSALLRDTVHAASLASRIGDLLPIQHPMLLGLIDHLHEDDGSQYLVSEWQDVVSLSTVVDHCIREDTAVPTHLFLHLAIGMCNALEALHGRPGAATGCKAVLHQGLAPHAVVFTRDGEVRLRHFGLVSAPTSTAHTGGLKLKRLYISPEQTHGEHGLTPSSDLFSLGALFHELLTHQSMFSGSTPLRTIAMVRHAEVTTQLLEIKEVFPGFDKLMYRLMSKNPRHRYQRAFVLREDLRALKAGYSFSNIEADARSFFAPLFSTVGKPLEEIHTPLPLASPDVETTLSLLDDSDGIEAPNLRVEDVATLSTPVPVRVRPSMPPVLASPETPRPPRRAPMPPEPMTPGPFEPEPTGTVALPIFLLVVVATALVVGCGGAALILGLINVG